MFVKLSTDNYGKFNLKKKIINLGTLNFLRQWTFQFLQANLGLRRAQSQIGRVIVSGMFRGARLFMWMDLESMSIKIPLDKFIAKAFWQ